MSNVKQTKDGLIEESSWRKIKSPLDIGPGSVIYSKEHDCKVTVSEIINKGILCVWFTGTKYHREIISENELLQT